jgi:hypothetical protein
MENAIGVGGGGSLYTPLHGNSNLLGIAARVKFFARAVFFSLVETYFYTQLTAYRKIQDQCS